MIDVLRIAHLRIAPQEGNSEVGNCEVHPLYKQLTATRYNHLIASEPYAITYIWATMGVLKVSKTLLLRSNDIRNG